MEYINLKPSHITYPFTSNITYKNCKPFIRIITNNYVYYGFEFKQLSLVDLNQKHSIHIFNTYQKPNENHYNLLKLSTSKLRGIAYELLYVSDQQYLCIGISNSNYVSLVILNIELNSKGHYEIQGLKDILKEK